MPIVVNIRKSELKKRGYTDFEDWNRYSSHLYIGRDMRFYVPGTIKSDWHNPFKGENACEKFEKYARDIFYDRLGELEGKVLGCWCHPQKCHGHILVKLYREKFS